MVTVKELSCSFVAAYNSLILVVGLFTALCCQSVSHPVFCFPLKMMESINVVMHFKAIATNIFKLIPKLIMD